MLTQHYKTQIVKLIIPLYTGTRIIEALVMPTISISLELPGLTRVPDCFVNKGYRLADDDLLLSKDVI